MQGSNNTLTIRKHTDTARQLRQRRRFEGFRAFSEIRDWMSSNRLKLNPSKTQWIWIGTRMQLAKIDRRELLKRFPGIVFESSVVDLGVVIDHELKMNAHVGIMTRSCFYQLRQLRTIRQSLSDDATRMLIHSFVVTRVDYCNSVLSGITVVQTDRVQRILKWFSVCSGSVVVTAYDFESGRPGSSPEWGLIYY